MKKSLRFISIFLIAVILFTGCGAKESEAPGRKVETKADRDYPKAEETESSYRESPSEENAKEIQSPMAPNPQEYKDRKVVITYGLSIQTKEFDLSAQTLMKQVQAHKGYVEQYDHFRDPMKANSLQWLQVRIRIPKEHANEFMKSLSDVGSMGKTTMSQDDRTDQYFDKQNRIESLQAQLKQLQELYSKATLMEDIITIQEKISNVLYEIEQLKGSLKKIDDLVDFATFNIELTEVREYTPTADVKESLGTKLKNAFSNMLENVRYGFEDFLVEFIYYLPTLIVLILLLVVLLILIRVIRRKKPKFLRWRKRSRRREERIEEPVKEEDNQESHKEAE